MHTTDQFLKFAAECQTMAKFTRNRESKAVWNGLAERWLRCADLMEREHHSIPQPHSAKRRHGSRRNLPH